MFTLVYSSFSNGRMGALAKMTVVAAGSGERVAKVQGWRTWACGIYDTPAGTAGFQRVGTYTGFGLWYVLSAFGSLTHCNYHI